MQFQRRNFLKVNIKRAIFLNIIQCRTVRTETQFLQNCLCEVKIKKSTLKSWHIENAPSQEIQFGHNVMGTLFLENVIESETTGTLFKCKSGIRDCGVQCITRTDLGWWHVEPGSAERLEPRPSATVVYQTYSHRKWAVPGNGRYLSRNGKCILSLTPFRSTCPGHEYRSCRSSGRVFWRQCWHS